MNVLSRIKRKIFGTRPSGLNKALLEIFRNHGIECVLRNDVLLFSNGMKATGQLFNSQHATPGRDAFQLDVSLEVETDRWICESSIGAGLTAHDALSVALDCFKTQSLHVLLAAFFDCVDQEQVDQEYWTFGASKRKVTLGCVAMRGDRPTNGEAGVQLNSALLELENTLRAYPLSPGLHWCRFFVGQAEGRIVGNEFLLDNSTCDELQAKLPSLPWPSKAEFYTVRQFLVIHKE